MLRKKSEEWGKKYDRIEEDVTRLFQRIRDEFPELEFDMDRGQAPDYVVLVMNIPPQPGLAFQIHLNLQNGDELHLSAGESLWCEWFPCEKESVCKKYYEAVTGLLSGRYRILEYYKNNTHLKEKLQKPVGDKWETISSSYHGILFMWGKTTKILQNTPSRDSVDPK